MDDRLLCERLGAYLPEGDRIAGLTRYDTGHSNPVYRIDGLDQVVRLAIGENQLLPTALDLRQQFDLFEELAASPGAPPVPAALLFCMDPAIVGAPFLVMDMAPGTSWKEGSIPPWVAGADPATRAAVSEQVVAALSALHRLPPLRALGPAIDAQAELRRWQGASDRFGPHDEFDRMVDRLCVTAPAPIADVAPCHGDLKLANTLWQDGRLTALLDWELAHNGDPRWDLGFLLFMCPSPFHRGRMGMTLPGFWQRERILEEWAIRTGRSAEGIAWFEAAWALKICVIARTGYELWRTGQNEDQRFSTWDRLFSDQLALAQKIASGWLD